MHEADGILWLILQGRKDEAIGLLRDEVFGWSVTGEGLLAFPLLFLQQDAMFDPLREMPEFQQILIDYEAHLRPLRQHVLKAERLKMRDESPFPPPAGCQPVP